MFAVVHFSRLLKNVHLSAMADSPRPSSLRRTSKYASLLRISGALSATGGDIFDQPYKRGFFSKLLNNLPDEVVFRGTGYLRLDDLPDLRFPPRKVNQPINFRCLE